MPSLIAVKPCGVRYLSPLRGGTGGVAGTMGIPLNALTGDPTWEEGRHCTGVGQAEPNSFGDMLRSAGTVRVEMDALPLTFDVVCVKLGDV